eukprot:GHVT01058482.1.p2 GENE.GHVT01058482.1~~GHVT01058482.1.p2  ORF type:complete len:136 (+),score=10.85 GHVT01058482.1:417-824(+)
MVFISALDQEGLSICSSTRLPRSPVVGPAADSVTTSSVLDEASMLTTSFSDSKVSASNPIVTILSLLLVFTASTGTATSSSITFLESVGTVTSSSIMFSASVESPASIIFSAPAKTVTSSSMTFPGTTGTVTTVP